MIHRIAVIRPSLSCLLVTFAAWSACSIAGAADPAAKNWPQLLGPNRNGISDEKGLIDKFPEDGPKVVWRIKGGIAMSGIALDGKQAITTWERDGQQAVVALDMADGKELWAQPVAKAFRNTMGPGTRATPTIAGGSVFVYTGEGNLLALDQVTGKIRWQHEVIKDYSGTLADYGAACSPLVADGLVIVIPGAESSSIVAYQADSGKLVWKTGDDTSGYSSPALLTVGGQRQIVAFTGKAAVGLDPATGRQLWRYVYTTDFDCNIANPIAVGDNVFISSGENHGSAMLSLKKAGDTFQVQEVWTSFGAKSVMRNEWQTSILLDGYLYGMDNVGGAGPITNLNCVNAKTGERVWQQAKFGKGNLIAADGKLFIVTVKGELVIVRATPDKFEELARAKVLDATRQAPALLNGRLYLRDMSEIVCVDVKKN